MYVCVFLETSTHGEKECFCVCVFSDKCVGTRQCVCQEESNREIQRECMYICLCVVCVRERK